MQTTLFLTAIIAFVSYLISKKVYLYVLFKNSWNYANTLIDEYHEQVALFFLLYGEKISPKTLAQLKKEHILSYVLRHSKTFTDFDHELRFLEAMEKEISTLLKKEKSTKFKKASHALLIFHESIRKAITYVDMHEILRHQNFILETTE